MIQPQRICEAITVRVVADAFIGATPISTTTRPIALGRFTCHQCANIFWLRKFKLHRERRIGGLSNLYRAAAVDAEGGLARMPCSAAAIPLGADQAWVFGLLPAVFDLPSALDDWTDPATLGAMTNFEPTHLRAGRG